MIYLYLITVTFFLFTSCSKNSDTNYKVTGELYGLENQDIYIAKSFSLDSIIVDTISLKDGKFEFEGMALSPALVNIFYSNMSPPINFAIDKDYSVEIKGEPNSINGIDIKGGKINEDLNDFKQQNKNILISRNKAYQKNERNNLGELKNIDLQLSRSVRDYVAKNPEKIASVILMEKFSKGNLSPELLSADLSLLTGEASDFYLTESLRKYSEKLLASSVGEMAPDIQLKSTNGKTIDLKSYRGKNVLLIFDLKESPSNTTYFQKLKETQKLLKHKVDFLTIIVDENVDTPDTTTLNVAKKLDWTVLLDCQKWNSKAALKYNVMILPYMILISPEGKIQERDVSLDSLKSKFEDIQIKKIKH